MAAVIAWVLPLLCEPRGLPIRGYGMMILLAVVVGHRCWPYGGPAAAASTPR